MKADQKEQLKSSKHTKIFSMSRLNSIMAIVVICSTIPLAIAIFGGEGLDFWFGQFNPQHRQPSDRINNPPHPPTNITSSKFLA